MSLDGTQTRLKTNLFASSLCSFCSFHLLCSVCCSFFERLLAHENHGRAPVHWNRVLVQINLKAATGFHRKRLYSRINLCIWQPIYFNASFGILSATSPSGCPGFNPSVQHHLYLDGFFSCDLCSVH